MKIELLKINKEFNNKKLFDDLNLSFESGRFYVIRGKSGVGKSTFLNILSLISKPDTGTILYDNKPAHEGYRSRTGILFQNSYLINELTLQENINIFSDSIIFQEYKTLAEKLNILELLEKKTRVLSVGERQRGSVFRVLCKKPDIIFADEPFASLDVYNKNIILESLKDFVFKEGKTVFLVTHDESIEIKNSVNIRINHSHVEVY